MTDHNTYDFYDMVHRTGLPCDPQCPVHAPANPIPDDVWNLQRFVEAQEKDSIFERAIAEIQGGAKRGHWMWFVFPQLAGLADNPTANNRRFALRGTAEAIAFSQHPVLGPRLERAMDALRDVDDENPVRLLGTTDAKKLRSCLTLFAYTGFASLLPRDPLEKFYNGIGDDRTLKLIIKERRLPMSLASSTDEVYAEPGRTHIALQSRKNGEVWLNLSCSLRENGDFVIEGHDMGPSSEYEWVTTVRKEHVPALVELLGGTKESDLLGIIQRDWVSVEGDGLERIIRLSSIPNEFSNFSSFD